MTTILSNKRFQFHTESSKDGGTVKLSGEVTVTAEGVVQSFNGQVLQATTGSTSDPVASYGSFSYSLMGDRAHQNLDVPKGYCKEALELLDDTLSEISEQAAEAETNV
jgi:hypothetical protein